MKQEKEILLPEMDVMNHLYTELKDKVETERDAMQRDLTEDIDLYIRQKIYKKQLSVINLRGEVGTGKSVLALELQRRHNALLEQVHKKKINNYKFIASDQIEFLRISRMDETDICVEIDEFSSLARTGANATTEQAEFEWFSDLCRIQGIHRVSCSPATILDKNALLILDVMGTRKDLKLTQVKVNYRNQIDGSMRVLGSAWLDVAPLLNESYYKQYEEKKVRRTRLIKDYGVRDIRDLEFANYGLKIIKLLKNRLQHKKPTIMQVRTKLVQIARKNKQLLSWFAKDEAIEPIMPILHNIYEFNREKNIEIKAELKEDITNDIEYLSWLVKGYHEYIGMN